MKAGRKQIVLTDKEKALAFEYVRTSGLNITSLAAILMMAKTTFYDILERDPDFHTGLRSARAEFRSKLVKMAKPEFLLERMFRKEFFLPLGNDKDLINRLEAIEKKLHEQTNP